MSTEIQTTRTKSRVSFIRRCLAWLHPYRASEEALQRAQRMYAEIIKVEQSNLALRKKCADLKAQLAAAQKSIEQLESALRLRN